MKISLEQSGGIYTAHSYLDNTIRIRPPGAVANDEDELIRIQGSCLLSAQRLIDDWPPQQMDEMADEHMAAVNELAPELLLIGSGTKMRFPAPQQLAALVRLGVGYEVMDTAAACRTYNVLAAEGRKVVAVLFSD